MPTTKTITAADDIDADGTGSASTGELSPSNPYITVMSSATIRSDFTGELGLKITVGNTQMVVTDLGRLFLTGNSGTHTVYIRLVSDSTNSVASASVNMVGGTNETVVYVSISPVTLLANTSYYIMGVETSGGDSWHDTGTITTTSDATTIASFYQQGVDPFTEGTVGVYAYSGPNFLYHL